MSIREKDSFKRHVMENRTMLPRGDIRGIYFLIDGNEIVYIGHSINCGRRIRKHIGDTSKEFDSYYIQPHPPELDLSDLEAHLIYHYTPKYNKSFPSNDHYASLKQIAKDYQGYGPHRVRNVLAENDVKVQGGIAPKQEAHEVMRNHTSN